MKKELIAGTAVHTDAEPNRKRYLRDLLMIPDNEMKPDSISTQTGLNDLKERMLPILKSASDICKTTTSLIYNFEDSDIKILASHGVCDEHIVSAVKKLTGLLDPDDGLSIIQNVGEHDQAVSLLSDVEMDEMQFFAGALFNDSAGTHIGAFCITDSNPREVSENQKQQLRMMAEGAKTHLMLYTLTELLGESNSKLEIHSALLNNSTDLTFLLDPEMGEIEDVSNGVEKELGYPPDTLRGKPFTDIVIEDELDGDTIDQWFLSENQRKGRFTTTVRFIDHQNRNRSYQCDFSADKNHWYVTARDITDKKTAEDGVFELQDNLRKIVSVATDLIYKLDWALGSLSWGDELTDVLGYPHTERFVDYDWWIDKIHPEDLIGVIHDVALAIDGESQKRKLIYRIRTYEGSYKYVMNRVYVDRNEDGTPESIIGAIVDISELVELEKHSKSTEKSLKEKQTLLSEIHHRVKNNLAVVSGMLQLQALNETDQQFQRKLFASIGRIKTMATIHELLYKSPSLATLRIDENIEEIITSLVSTIDISLDLDVSYSMDPVELNINDALPCSLIINEVITNVLKYAYDDGDSGSLNIYLTQENETVTLKIRDDGKGLPEDFNVEGNGSSLGMVLIKSLSKQLDGTYSYRSLDRGVEFELVFDKSENKSENSQLE